MKSMKSISDNELIHHKLLNKVDTLSFDENKSRRKVPKNRTPIVSGKDDQRSAFGVRLCLKEFCIEFLNGAYNTFMYNVKNNIVRSKAQEHDESYYLWALRFFMEFNRCHHCEMKLVRSVLDILCGRNLINNLNVMHSNLGRETVWFHSTIMEDL